MFLLILKVCRETQINFVDDLICYKVRNMTSKFISLSSSVKDHSLSLTNLSFSWSSSSCVANFDHLKLAITLLRLVMVTVL